jgi:2-oxoglutarate dehydrogenase E2 component (dihydrolipoamide succinyltransferase)
MPQLGETVTEGTITRWLKQVGDEIGQDEVLFEVSTDKVDSEVPSPAAGYLAEILVPEGETVDVGARLAVITAEPPGAAGGGDGADTATEAPESQAAQSEPAPAPAPAPAPEPTPVPEPAPAPDPAPAAEPVAAGRVRDAGSVADAPTDGQAAGQVLSPVVRRLLAEHDLDPSQIRGTGAGNRITRADVLAVIDARSGAGGAPIRAAPSPAAPTAGAAPAAPAAPPPPAASASPPSRPAVVTAPVGGRDEAIPFSNIRRRTAEHMVRSKATSAHTLVAIEADFEAVDRVRRAERERFRSAEGISLTYLPFVARATIEALRAFPNLNASVGDDALIVHHDLHLGIAVDLDSEGLIVPVIHHADDKRLPVLAREASDLASRARERRLGADDIAGGTFTITNPGPFGTLITVPIINQPQVGILSTDGVKRKPVVVTLADGGEGIAIHSVGVLALSFDHRAVDGAYASRFLAKLREILETRDWSQEL